MSTSESESSNGFDVEENFVDFDEADGTTSIPPKDTADTFVSVPEVTEANLTFVPILAHPLFEEVGYDFILHQFIEFIVPKMLTTAHDAIA